MESPLTDTPPFSARPVKPPNLADLGVDPAKPLLLVDVDEVLGLFMEGFGRFLEGRGLEFRVDRFALFQNIFRPGEAEHLPIADGRNHFDDFFRYGCGDMEPAPGAVGALEALSRQASVVIFTNAPGPARLARARWLGRHRMDYPLVLNTGPKGPLAAGMANQVRAPAVFVDDLMSNLDSVAESAPHVIRFQMVADRRLQPLAPSAPDRHTRIDDWDELRAAIEAAIG
ncbi:hypothetical protein M9M90_09565 [Phenylobacterium sp. LH3H17]|uniref:hypothetical protein n=1 Tax=Phenylobacterium sp. LH3H17 TaxID=2903901 RepID=UPI0020C98A99|nr:hypothetical protein [Phenylobacterium sp. LH3H17]UTP41401.1 hypothetical protein M9M90_09565 [Phenylobacterium sp. LH3H17]